MYIFLLVLAVSFLTIGVTLLISTRTVGEFLSGIVVVILGATCLGILIIKMDAQDAYQKEYHQINELVMLPNNETWVFAGESNQFDHVLNELQTLLVTTNNLTNTHVFVEENWVDGFGKEKGNLSFKFKGDL